MKVGARVKSVDFSVTGEVVGNGWLKDRPVILVLLDKGGYVADQRIYISTIVADPENFEEV